MANNRRLLEKNLYFLPAFLYNAMVTNQKGCISKLLEKKAEGAKAGGRSGGFGLWPR